jgi:hypothetical protein
MSKSIKNKRAYKKSCLLQTTQNKLDVLNLILSLEEKRKIGFTKATQLYENTLSGHQKKVLSELEKFI